MAAVEQLHHYLLWITAAIVLFVLGLLLFVAVRFSAGRNKVPSTTSHNTKLEVFWTIAPILILIAIVTPSMHLLYDLEQVEDSDTTIKVTGNQWYWTYQYPDHRNFSFDSYMIATEDLKPNQKRMLSTDQPLVLPVDTKIRILVTSADVIHSFAIPAFGIKTDAVPGRLNETWAYIPTEYAGRTFYGQCSELCGINHSFMPIEVLLLSKADFVLWTQKAQKEFAGGGFDAASLSADLVQEGVSDKSLATGNPPGPTAILAGSPFPGRKKEEEIH